MSIIDEPAKIEEAIRAILVESAELRDVFGTIAFESGGKDPVWPLLLLSAELISEPVQDQSDKPFYFVDAEAVIRTKGSTADEAIRLVNPARRALLTLDKQNRNGFYLTGPRIENVERTFYDPQLEEWEKTINWTIRAATDPL